MSGTEDEKQHGELTRAVFFSYATAALLLSLVTAYFYVGRGPVHSLLDLPFYVGETTWNLIRGSGLSFRTYPIAGQMVWMHAARMPVVTLYVTAATLYLGPSQMLLATLIKTTLLLLPVLGAARLVLYRCVASRQLLFFAAFTLTLPLLVPAFLADVVNLQVEEGFAYAFLVIAFTLVATGPPAGPRTGLLYTVSVAAALDLLYLSKSSMILAVAVLVGFSLFRKGANSSRVLLLFLVAAAPVGWALRQHAVSGRYALGTSLDGGNFHKGNFAQFLAHYPPADGDNLDDYEGEIAPPKPLGDEWAYNDWHNREAIRFIRSHPRQTLIGWERKASVYLIALHVYGNGAVSAPKPVTALGMILFRLLLWAAIAISATVLIRGGRGQGGVALLYLGMLVACTVPYLAGFGYTRHASVLVYPSAVAICLLAAGRRRDDPAVR